MNKLIRFIKNLFRKRSKECTVKNVFLKDITRQYNPYQLGVEGLEISIKQCAESVGLSVKQVYTMIKKGTLERSKKGFVKAEDSRALFYVKIQCKTMNKLRIESGLTRYEVLGLIKEHNIELFKYGHRTYITEMGSRYFKNMAMTQYKKSTYNK